MSAAPQVSIIMPCYNAGAHLREAVRSALAQQHPRFEIVIVDDGSSDVDTLALLERFDDSRIRVLHRPHGGVTRARNAGIEAAAGEYLCFFDCDDRMHPDLLSRAAARLDGDPSLTFVSFWVRLFGDEDWVWKQSSCDLLALLNDCSVATAALVRKAAVVAAGGFDVTMELGHEDWDLWLSLVERGGRGVILPEILFDYRRRPDSRSTVADRGAVYLELFRDRVRKHAGSYRERSLELVWMRESTITQVMRHLRCARAIEAELDASLAAARAELDAQLSQPEKPA